MFLVSQLSSDTCLIVEAVGHISGDEYETFAQRVEGAVEKHGEINLVINLRGPVMYGDTQAFKDDWRFVTKQYRHVRRLALVGEMNLVVAATRIFAPFTRTEEGFFGAGEVDAAIDWACAEA